MQRWGANYWEDFFQPKIIWKRVGSILRFSFDIDGTLGLDSTCFATGKNIKYLTAILNSKLGSYLLKDSPQTGTGDLLISVQAIEPLLIPILNESDILIIENILDLLLLEQTASKVIEFENQISNLIYSNLGFSDEEIEFIES